MIRSPQLVSLNYNHLVKHNARPATVLEQSGHQMVCRARGIGRKSPVADFAASADAFTLTSMLYEHQKPWKPLNPTEVATVFQEAAFPWWIAGGYAIEHFVGRQVRAHADIDILVLRKHSTTLRCYLSG
jgi:Aminoglycoside-2''-adenylyltransferase